METITVTTEYLHSAATQINALADQYFNEYQALLTEVQDLTSTDWQGSDANAFLEKVTSFQQDFTLMKECMVDYAQYIESAAVNYETTQEDIKSRVSNLGK